MKTNTDNTVSVRLRFAPEECRDLDRVRQFLDLPSLSSAAHRLALWNAHTLAAALSEDPAPVVDSVGDVARDIARLAVRRSLLAGGAK